MAEKTFPADTVVRLNFENVTEGYGFSAWDEPLADWWLAHKEDDDTVSVDVARMFRELQREYGRCTGRVYVDTADGAKPIGWHFGRTMQYEDSRDEYVRGVWVSFAVKHPVRYESLAV